MRVRLAIVLGVLLLVGAALATFLPTSPDGASCGTWVAPAWSKSTTQDLVDRASESEHAALGADRSDLADQAAAIRLGAMHSYLVCSSALSTRRTWALVLLVFAVLVPAGVWFFGGATSRQSGAARTAPDDPQRVT